MDKTKNKINNEIISFVILPMMIFLMLDIFFYIYNTKNYCILYMSTKTLFLSLFICYTCYLILYSILKKTWKAITILAIFFLIFNIINQIKITYTNEPIVFSDILYLRSSDELLGIIDGTIYDSIKSSIPITIIYATISVAICILSHKYNVDIMNNKYRCVLCIIPAISLLMLFYPLNYTKNIFLNFFFDIEERKDYDTFTTNLMYFENYGVISGMYGQILENRIEKPLDYNEDAIQNELKTKEGNENNSFGKPNIIVVFSESFWDIGQLEEVKFNTEVTPNLKKIKEEGIFFDMISPSYGGVSANVEFEFLTGANLMYFNKGYIPYMQLYKNATYFNRPSIISELKNNGYKTEIVAYTSEKLFECGKFYNYIGVDKTEYIKDYSESQTKGYYISDEVVTDRIIDVFNNKKEEEKIFYMTLTMQAHMPYVLNKYDFYDVYVEKSNFAQEVNDTLTSYAQGIYDADKQLGRLYDYIKTLEEPTMIVFFGDHLPYLYTKGGENAIDKLEYFNTDDELKNIYRKYNTQSVIIANFEIEQEEDLKFLGPDLLSTYILNKMDIEIQDYYKWLYSTRNTIGASNYYVTVDNKGNIYNTNNLKGKMKELYNLRRNIQYKYFIK